MDHKRLYLTRFLKVAGLAGLLAATVPFLGALPDLQPAPGEGETGIDLGDLPPGGVREMVWRGRPVLVYRRQAGEAPSPRPGLHPELVVLSPLEGLRGCRVRHVPAGAADAPVAGWEGGFVEPCFGARFDLSGRRDPASGRADQGDLPIPPHRIAGGTHLVGE
jgi:ubiquinol-cytochrome c reductase iron-sulfur subunit